ncbi:MULTISPECIES: Ig-like domain-containing protein [Burkholderia]|uniref:Bacterial Ig-like domain-containing protein n=1 Tax=Burkholderia pyrrocinia TaxID=60550 RepID=A0A318HXM4_BURPY|nr:MULTISPECIES: Ig-like domain-containing protein [Burkholderia]PXX21400.1 hypothetical protein NA66_10517 [Burkholderia pyrrocinia]SFW90617.1 hypothetical protein SAMN03159384_07059 [Burkholderia sp. NFACC33-1]SFY46513.1 hypothetical protein SAMN03159408_07052 [Burkholderia sp. NFPP32]
MSTVKLAVVDGNTIKETLELRASQQGTAARVRAPQGAKFILAESQSGYAPQNITVSRVGKNLHLSLEGTSYDQPQLIIEDFYGNEGQLVGLGEDGAYHEYIASDAEQDHAIALLADGKAAPQVLGAEQMVGFGAGLVAAPGIDWLGLGLFGLGALGVLGGALAAGLIGGGKDDGGNGGDGGGGGRPGQPSIDSVFDNVGDVTGPIDRGGVTDDRRPVFTGKGETPGNKVEIYDNGKKIGETVVKEDGSWTFQPDRPLEDGKHDFVAVEIDPEGNASLPSPGFEFEVDPTAPDRPVITGVIDNFGDEIGPIASGERTDDRTPEIRGTAQKGSLVMIYDGDVLLGSTMADADGNWMFVPATPLADGPHVFTATATSPVGSVGLPSDPWTVIVGPSDGGRPQTPAIGEIWDNTDPDNQTPIGDGDRTKDKTPVIGGEGTPGNTVIVIIDDEVVGSTVVGDDGKWTFEPVDELDDGGHKFEVIERDPNGRESDKSDPVTVIVDSPVQPVITDIWDNTDPNNLIPIPEGETSNDDTPLINGTAKPGSVVEIFDNGNSIGSTTADAETGRWTFQPDMPLSGTGGHSLTAVATDPLHGPITSDPFNFALDPFEFGLIYGVESFADLQGSAGTQWQPGATHQTKLFDITRVGAGGQVVAIDSGGSGAPSGMQVRLSPWQGGVPVTEFDLRGNTAQVLTFEWGIGGVAPAERGFVTIEFFDAGGQLIKTHELKAGEAGLMAIEMPAGHSFASFRMTGTVEMSQFGNAVTFDSMILSDKVLPLESFKNIATGTEWDAGQTIDSGLFAITHGGGSHRLWLTIWGTDHIRKVLAAFGGGSEITFDLKGKNAGGLTFELGAVNITAADLLVATITFKDENGKEVHTKEIYADGPGQFNELVSINMPTGLAYSSFVITTDKHIYVDSISTGVLIESPQSTNGVESENGVHDLVALDGLGGEVFYVSEGEEDAIEFTGTDSTDMLKLTGEGQVLDLSNLQGKLSSVEVIDLTGTGDNTLKLSLGDVLEQGGQGLFINDGKTQMMVRGDAGDVIELSDLLPDGSDVGDWAQMSGTVTVEGVTYNVYQHSGLDVELLVQQGVTTHIV